ncbi:MAG: glutamate mutase L [Caldisericia bacterium]|nr:glutamate mutase L [Caldisericia bacterium]
MRVHTLVVEIGSTITKVSAFSSLKGRNPRYLGKGIAKTTVDEGDVTRGLERAIDDLKNKLGTHKLTWTHLFGNSSAAGGLRMTVHGLVLEMTAKAAKEAALGAGAIVKLITAGLITPHDLKKIEEIKPNIILLSGGVDFGEDRIVVENAKRLSTISIKPPVVFAGNRAVRDIVRDIFKSKGFKVYITENVYPEIDKLNIEPVRKVIQGVFEEHIIHAPGMEKIRNWVEGDIIPTPGAVMNSFMLLYKEIGDIMGFDVGGATTDVHSVTKGKKDKDSIVIYPEPIAKRTVEGDLGVYVSAKNVLNEIDPLNREEIEKKFKYLSPIPEKRREVNLTKKLAEICVKTALLRHVGEVRYLYTPTGKIKAIFGKDLRNVKWVVGTGGVFTHIPSMKTFLKRLFKNTENERLLLPTNPKILIDKYYIFSAMGTISNLYPIGAKKLLLESLGFKDNLF